MSPSPPPLSPIFRISIPSEPDFVKSARQSPYADPKWLAGMKHAVTVDKNKNDISAKEQEAHLQVMRSEKDSLDKVSDIVWSLLFFPVQDLRNFSYSRVTSYYLSIPFH